MASRWGRTLPQKKSQVSLLFNAKGQRRGQRQGEVMTHSRRRNFSSDRGSAGASGESLLESVVVPIRSSSLKSAMRSPVTREERSEEGF